MVQITDATGSTLKIDDFERERETVIGPTQKVSVILAMVDEYGESQAKELLKPESERGFMPEVSTKARSIGNGVFIELLRTAEEMGLSFPTHDDEVRAFMNEIEAARNLVLKNGVKRLRIGDARKSMKYFIVYGDKHWAVTTLRELLEHRDFWE